MQTERIDESQWQCTYCDNKIQTKTQMGFWQQNCSFSCSCALTCYVQTGHVEQTLPDSALKSAAEHLPAVPAFWCSVTYLWSAQHANNEMRINFWNYKAAVTIEKIGFK